MPPPTRVLALLLVLTHGVTLLGVLTTGLQGGLGGVFFLMAFAGFPVLINAAACWQMRTAAARWIGCTAALGYSIWFFIINAAVQASHDAQAAITYVFVGVYALPILIPLWMAMAWCERRARTTVRPRRISP